jgi:hypothetical protein
MKALQHCVLPSPAIVHQVAKDMNSKHLEAIGRCTICIVFMVEAWETTSIKGHC